MSASTGIGGGRGAFAVDRSGQATYEVKIEAPPGPAGFQPELSLIYRHRGRNGVAGMGWSLKGLSSLRRVRANYVHDGFNGSVTGGSDDRLALDGQRLVALSGAYGAEGTVYGVEPYDFSWVQAGQSPDQGFQVRLRSGVLLTYGSRPDSRVLLASGAVAEWLLDSMCNLCGTLITYQYTTTPLLEGGARGGGGSNTAYLDAVSYGGRDGTPPDRSVQCLYEGRPDEIVSYFAGTRSEMAYRLAEVRSMAADPTCFRAWRLAYEQGGASGNSRITSIAEVGVAGETLPATLITWQDVTEPGLVASVASVLDQHADAEVLYASVSGSGASDIIQIWEEGGQWSATTYTASQTSRGTEYFSAGTVSLGQLSVGCRFFAAEVDGSGRGGLLCTYRSLTGTLVLGVCLSNGETLQPFSIFDTGDPWLGPESLQFFAMDANGDGRVDLVEAYAESSAEGEVLCMRTYLSRFGSDDEGGFSPAVISQTQDPARPGQPVAFWAMDVNQDGAMDLVRVLAEPDSGQLVARVYMASSQSLDDARFDRQAPISSSLGTFDPAEVANVFPADVNGDGLQDLVMIWSSGAAGAPALSLSTFFSSGDGRFVAGPVSTFPDEAVGLASFFPLDFFGCGMTAIAAQWLDGDQKLNISLFPASSSGTYGQGAVMPSGLQGQLLMAAHVEAADPNGDGRADLLSVAAGTDQQAQILPLIGAGTIPDYVSSFTSPLGDRIALAYVGVGPDPDSIPATFPFAGAARFPHRIAPASFPAQATTGLALHVVDHYTRRNDEPRNRFASSSRHSFKYGGGQINLLGLGWLGFATVRDLDESKGRAVTSTYRLDAPFTGELASAEVAADSGFASDSRVPAGTGEIILQRKSYEYSKVPRTVRDGAKPLFQVLRTGEIQEDFDYGQADGAIARSYVYDAFGNATCETYLGYVDPVRLQPLDVDSVVHRFATYQNTVLSDGWVLDLPLSAKVTANPTDPEPQDFTAGDFKLECYTYDPAKFTPASVSRWDSLNGVFLTSAFETDAWGNLTRRTDPSGLVTSTLFDPDYRTYRSSVFRSLPGKVELVDRYASDPLFGIEVGHRDANGAFELLVLDQFGRLVAAQATAPGAVTDPNGLSARLTGTGSERAAFRSAAVLTGRTIAYGSDSSGGQFSTVSVLERFPVDGERHWTGTVTYFDSLERPRARLEDAGSAAGRVVRLTDYDSDGRVVRQTLPAFGASVDVSPACAVVTSFDVLGRPTSIATPSGAKADRTSVSTFSYRKGGIVQATAAQGSAHAFTQTITSRYVDGARKIVSVAQQGAASASMFDYDAIGRRISLVDPATCENPKGVATRVGYDSLDRRVWTDNPDQNTAGDGTIHAQLCAYDVRSGALCSVSDASGAVTRFAVDALCRPTDRILPDGRTFSFKYDVEARSALGRLASVEAIAADGSLEAEHTFTYDSRGNLSGRTVKIGPDGDVFALASSYDPRGRLVAKRFPGGSLLTRTYEADRLVKVALDGAEVTQPIEDFDPFANPGRTLAAGFEVSRAFSPAGELADEELTVGTGEPTHFTFDYDDLSRLSATTQDGLETTYTYAGARLASVAGAVRGAFSYDDSGNIMSKDGVAFSHQAHLTLRGTSNGQTVYSAAVDACGRTVHRSSPEGVLDFSYDGAGRLSAVTDAAGERVRTYRNDYRDQVLTRSDADGSRILFVDRDYQVVLQGGKTIKIIRRLSGQRAILGAIVDTAGSSEIHFYRHDHKGNTTHVVKGPTSVEEIRYDPFGHPRSDGTLAATQPTYEERLWDPLLGLLDFGGRLYDPSIGRFLTPDTGLGGSHLLLQDVLNRFAFELNDPYSYVDWSGHSSDWIGGLVIGLVAVGAAAAIVATGGLATPLATAVVTGALVGGGLGAITFSAQHRETGQRQFWEGFAVSAGTGAAIGAATAYVGSVGSSAVLGRILGAGLSDAEAALAVNGASLLPRLGVYAVVGAATGTAADVGNQFMSNVTSRYIMGQDTGLGDNIGLAAGLGAGFGALGGGLQASGENYALRRISQTVPGDHFDDVGAVEMQGYRPQRQNLMLPNDNPEGVGLERETLAERRLAQFAKLTSRVRGVNASFVFGTTSAAPDAYENWRKTS